MACDEENALKNKNNDWWRAPYSLLMKTLAGALIFSVIDDVLNGRQAQSRWASAQAVEKTLKAILVITSVAYPTRGAEGHDLLALADKLEKAHGVTLPRSIVALAQCSPAVRYGEEASSENQALSANHAVLGIMELLMKQQKLERLQSGY